jgi:hypothetical protein
MSLPRIVLLSSNLALDAPLVAASWWYLLAESFGKNLDWQVFFSLFPAVWAIYLIDRIRDGAVVKESGSRINEGEIPARKRFARDHLVLLKILLGLALGWAVGGACLIPIPVWWQIGVIGAGTGGYFFRNHWISLFRKIPAKEVLISFCFAAGVGLPFARPISGLMLLTFGLFGVLCFLNCLMISHSESASDGVLDPEAWFAKSGRCFPFRLVLVGHAIATLVLMSLGLPLIPGCCLLISNGFLFLINCFTVQIRPFVQIFCDTALWLPGLVGSIFLMVLMA